MFELWSSINATKLFKSLLKLIEIQMNFYDISVFREKFLELKENSIKENLIMIIMIKELITRSMEEVITLIRNRI